jgi:hypothetical protein
VLLYRMVTGRVPFEGNSVAVMLGHLNRAPRPPRQLDADIDPALEAIILRCLAKAPGRRFQSADELQRALQSVAEGSVQLSVRRRRRTTHQPTSVSAFAETAVHSDVEDTHHGDSLEVDINAFAPRRVGRWLAAMVAALMLIGGGGLYAAETGAALPGVGRISMDLSTAVAAGASSTAERARAAAALENVTHRAIVVGQGGYSMRVLLPARAMRDVEYEIILDAWDPHGEALTTSELVVTLEGPDGLGHGVVAKPTARAGRYRFRRAFVRAGAYVLRVYPPQGTVAVNVFFDVLDPDEA